MYLGTDTGPIAGLESAVYTRNDNEITIELLLQEEICIAAWGIICFATIGHAILYYTLHTRGLTTSVCD